ncbi:hypothetical protein EZJ19_04420 [Parasulfuritortus cantonensis]|uniref:Uncharacterized protein n=1 Tax=Parasulfuritortus cantonensis TaxID=2528202 RepID=A0A4V2NWG2_9PROT|nr:hypothetical protein [Parasulfuritortus cantonensis]TCJ17202.1 hypothetical protein EZJ19_04420 [Parasulfuritortus cantonensis]
MRSHSILLSKTCPYCGARAKAEARLPVPAHAPAPEFNLDNLAGLVRNQSLSQLLALVELLPYKTFTCAKCGAEFRLESHSVKDLVGNMLGSMQPAPPRKPVSVGSHAPKRTRKAAATPAAAPGPDWEAESLDAVVHAPADTKPET